MILDVLFNVFSSCWLNPELAVLAVLTKSPGKAIAKMIEIVSKINAGRTLFVIKDIVSDLEEARDVIIK